jgi:hypothetical protein
VVAEIVPPQPGRSPFLADALLAEAVREGWLAPPVLTDSEPPPRKPVKALRDLMRDLLQDRKDRYLLMAEDRFPPRDLWQQRLASSRLLDEVSMGLTLTGSNAGHGDAVRA